MSNREEQQFGDYRLLHLLGQGAFAEVYLGEYLYMERPAALKIPHTSIHSGTHKSFRDEACILAQLQHPHIVGIYECGVEDEIPYLVLEYLLSPNLLFLIFAFYKEDTLKRWKFSCNSFL